MQSKAAPSGVVFFGVDRLRSPPKADFQVFDVLDVPEAHKSLTWMLSVLG